MAYNYKKAAEVYNKFFTLCCDPFEFIDSELQQERRKFLRAITRKEDMTIYTDYIKEEKHNVCDPWPDAKSKCWDFDLMRQYDELINEIMNFEN